MTAKVDVSLEQWIALLALVRDGVTIDEAVRRVGTSRAAVFSTARVDVAWRAELDEAKKAWRVKRDEAARASSAEKARVKYDGAKREREAAEAATAPPAPVVEVTVAPRGSPTLFTAERGARVVAALEAGMDLRALAEELGLKKSLLWSWVARGRRGLAPYVPIAQAFDHQLERVTAERAERAARAAENVEARAAAAAAAPPAPVVVAREPAPAPPEPSRPRCQRSPVFTPAVCERVVAAIDAEQPYGAIELALGLTGGTIGSWVQYGKEGRPSFVPIFEARQRQVARAAEAKAAAKAAAAAPPPKPTLAIVRPSPKRRPHVDTRPLYSARSLREACADAAGAGRLRDGYRFPDLPDGVWAQIRKLVHVGDPAARDGLALRILAEVEGRSKDEARMGINFYGECKTVERTPEAIAFDAARQQQKQTPTARPENT
jgi:hypothetical protein